MARALVSYLVAACLVVVACSGGDADPCHGLERADRLPERVGGHAFGEVHEIAGGGVLDLSDFEGCEFPDGDGVLVLLEGRFVSAYHLDCENVTVDRLPTEIQPTEMWLCYGPSGGTERSPP